MPADAVLLEPKDFDELDAALASFKASGVEVIGIDGGDGTVREVLSRLQDHWERPPAIALLPRGNTNLIAREVGGWQGADGAERLTAALQADLYAVARPPLLRVQRHGLPTLRGLILGVGAYATATVIGQGELAARGDRQVAAAVLTTLWRLLFGRNAGALRQGVRAALSLDGGAGSESQHLVVIVTAGTKRLPLGLNPFWGRGLGKLRWLDIEAPGHRLALAAPFVAFGRPLAWFDDAGYRSGRASRFELFKTEPFVLDGDLFATGEGGHLKIDAPCDISFVSP